MRTQPTAGLLVLLALLPLTPVLVAPAHSQTEVKNAPAVAQELSALLAELNQAVAKKDRPALERIYADEFQFVHSTGNVVRKAEQIDRIMTNAPGFSIPLQNFDQVQVYGDVAMLRTSEGSAFGVNLFVRRSGRWQILQVQGTRKPPERRPIELPAAVTDVYPGKYEFSPGRVGVVSKDGGRLHWKGGGRPTVTLVPISDTRFYAEETDVELIFQKDGDSKVTGLTLRLGTCQDSTAKKVE